MEIIVPAKLLNYLKELLFLCFERLEGEKKNILIKLGAVRNKKNKKKGRHD